MDATQYKTTAGGKGLANSITGTATFYGGGGAGGKTNTNAANGYPASSASGGLGGGGESGQPGIDGTGGGGGGGNGDGNTTADFVKRIGGKGGDGIVIIRFPYLSP